MEPEKRPHVTGWKATTVWGTVIFLLTLTYAIIRYIILLGVYWSDLPLYVNNKAIALSAVIFIAISIIFGPLSVWKPRLAPRIYPLRKTFGLLGFGMAAIHGLISLLLFSPQFFPRFFDEIGKVNLVGELAILFGVLGLAVFTLVAITSLPSMQVAMPFDHWKRVQRLGYLAFFFVLLHVFVMGFERWLRPEIWPGGLLPVTLIAFIVILLAFLVRIISIFRKR